MISQNELHTIRNNTYIYVLSQSINGIDLFYPGISGQYIHVMQSRFCTFGQNAKYIRIPCISIDRGLVYIKKVDLFCHNTWMSSTPTPHLKITPSTSPRPHLIFHSTILPPKYTYFYSKPTSYQPYITHTKPLTKSIHCLTSYTNSKI